MTNPFSIKAVRIFARSEFRKGVPERRIPLRCAQRFKAFGLEAWIWEDYTRQFLDSLKQEIMLSNETLDTSNVVVADANDTEQIFKYIRHGGNLFITGKAGTGKTTLLKKIVERFSTHGEVAVVAPTGIAAKNADGVTIHSFLQIPIGPWVPESKTIDIYRVSERTKEIINNISMLIIDEVSMVRCDLLDEVDEVLRFAKQSMLPFGGIQLVLFGDLYQLMPVVEDDDWEILKTVYDSPFFFSSKAFQRIKRTVVELKKVYRQDEPEFVDLLNAVRIGDVAPSQLEMLNSRCSDDESLPRGAIRLTTHNRRANHYNRKMLDSIPKEEYTYKAWIEKDIKYMDIPKSDWPTDYYLNLKVGARVMFLRNDNLTHRFVNGTLGTVVDLWTDGIQVRTDDGQLVSAVRHTWDFYTYRYDKVNKVVTKERYATFKQFPLRLAWSVTIHKSQGLTFDKVVIDASKSFAAGQVYVALSRCRTLAGVRLTEKLTRKNIITDEIIKQFLDTLGLSN